MSESGSDESMRAGPSRPVPPGSVRDLAHARREARQARDWARADQLKAEIEAAGWRVVDRGVDFALLPASPPDLEVDGVRVHGSAAAVPSLFDRAPSVRVSILFVGDEPPPSGEPAGAAADGSDPGGAGQVQLLAVRPGPSQRDDGVEVVCLPEGATPATLLAAGLRRCVGELVLVALDPTASASLTARGSSTGGSGALEGVEAFLAALADPSVAVVGSAGARTGDLRTLEPVEVGEADILVAGLLAFRRADAIPRLPLDERVTSPDRVAAWWSLRLREPVDPSSAEPVRRALVIPLAGAPATERVAIAAADRSARRDFYRLHDRFGDHPELLTGPARR